MGYRTNQKGKVDQSKTCLPIINGGTLANNVVDAGNNMKLVTNSKKNIPFGVAGINSNNKIDPSILPPGLKFDGSVNVTGPVSLTINQIQAYTITDYDINTTYTITAIGGTVSRTGATITYTAPGVTGNSGFVINGKDVVIAVGTALINTPSITSPSTGSSNMLGSVTILSTAFAVSSGVDTHEGSDWQIATDAGFTSIVSQVTNDATNKVTWNVSSLTNSTTYYVRVRYKGTIYGYSNWSSTINFTTKAVYAPSLEKAILLASDKVVGDKLGFSVSIDSTGTRAIVGAYWADPANIAQAGKVYIFLRTGTSWAQEQILIASDKISGDQFGSSVAISADGTRCVIGSNLANSSGVTDTGQAYVFLRTGTVWAQEQILTASDKGDGHQFGSSVAITADGSRIIVGAQHASPGGITSAGASYIFTRTITTWSQEQILMASDKITGDNFGVSVAITADGSRIIVGAHQASPGGTSQAGKAYVFTRSGVTWTQEQMLITSDKAVSDMFGISVDIDDAGVRCVIGAYYASPGGITAAGKAYVFTRAGVSWTEEQILSASNKSTSDNFGQSVSIDSIGSIISIGSPRSNPGGLNDAGSIYIYSRSGVTWGGENILSASDKSIDSIFGTSVAMSGDSSRCIVGAPLTNPTGIIDAGSAYIYG